MKQIEVITVTEEQFNREIKTDHYVELLINGATEEDLLEEFPADEELILDAVFMFNSGCF